jgi:hypothetical protein
MIAVIALMTVSLLNFSCDKQPVGPDGPDPVPPPPPGTYLSFTDFRALYTGADITVPAGTKKIRGVVISNSLNEAKDVYRLQDESGAGIYLFAALNSPVYSMGNVLDIDAAGAGKLISYNGDLELMSVPQAKVVPVAGSLTVTPRITTIAQIIANRNTWASSLVKVNSITSIVQASTNAAGVTYNITDATGTMSMFVRLASGITVNTSATSVTGYISIFNATTQIGIRTAADLQ